MIYQKEILKQIIDRSVVETLKLNRSNEGYRVVRESMLMLILPALEAGEKYYDECAVEEYGWKDKYNALIRKTSNKDFSRAQQIIRNDRKTADLEKRIRDLEKINAEKDARIESLEQEVARLTPKSSQTEPTDQHTENMADGTDNTADNKDNVPDNKDSAEQTEPGRILETVTIPKDWLDNLQMTLKKYEEKAARGPATSNNSSLPPSKNPIGYKHKRSTREVSGKKPGGQIGHKGYSHELSSNPDTIVQHFPKICPDCGREIDPDSLSIQARRQQAHWPPMHIYVIEHQVMAGECKCGCHIKGEFPLGVNSPFSFSLACIANLAYMSVFLTAPHKRLSEFLSNCLKIKISPATIANSLKRVSEAVGPYLDSLRQAVSTAEVNCLDETALKVKVDKENFWIWANVALDILGNCIGVYMELCDDRRHENIAKICPDKRAKNVVHDRKADYFNPEYLECENHQVCLAHLKRDTQAIIEAVPESDWAKRFQDILNRIFVTKGTWIDPAVPPDITSLEMNLDNLLNDRPNLDDKAHQETIDKFIIAMEKNRPHLLTCLKVFAVPPTNNPAESCFRMTKSKQNSSSCFRTQNGADDYVRTFCTIQNQRSKGNDPVEFLINCLEQYAKAPKAN